MSTSSRTTSPKKPTRRRAPRAKKAAGTKRAAAAKTSSLSAAKDSLSIMALSPYRLPVDVERLAMQTARIGGFAFVFLGLVFTYNYIETTATNYIVEASRVANVATVACAGDCERQASKTPSVQFTYDEIANGVFNILVEVPRAESVEAFAYETATGEYRRLGEAISMGDNRWKYTWNTEGYATGDYWVKAVVVNRYGMYDRSDTEYLKVQ